MVNYVDIRKSRGALSSSLKRHLALGFGLFTLLLSAGLSFLVEHLAAESSMRQIGLQLAQRALETRDRIDRGIYERYRDIRALAEFDTGRRDPVASHREQIEIVRAGRPLYLWIAHADVRGRVLAADGSLAEGADLSSRPWFARALRRDIVEDAVEQGGAASPDGGTKQVVVVSVPVRDEGGSVTGLVIACLDWDALREARPLLTGSTRLIVLSREGVVLYGIEALEGRRLDLRAVREASIAQGVWYRERWPDGDRYVTAATVTRGHPVVPVPQWKVVLRQDPGEALEEVARMQLQIVASGAVLGLVFAALAWWFATRVASPLVAIAGSADRLAAGERDLSIPAVAGYAEIERLGASLRAMLSSLRRQEEDLLQARDKLELRVRERSAELTRIRADLEATIVELELAQRELGSAKDRLDLALEAAEIAVWTYDLPSGRIELSEQWALMLGGAHGASVASLEDVAALIPESERALVRQAIDAAAAGATPGYVVRHHVRRANGELMLTESRGKVVVRDAGGAAVRMAGTVRRLDTDAGTPGVRSGP